MRELCLEQGVVEAKEDDIIILVPKASLSAKSPPRLPAFYNPAAKLNRDISIKIYDAYISSMPSEATFADVLAGVGVRGLRVAKECGRVSRVYINDVNPVAVELARRAAELNGVLDRCVFTNKDALLFLAEHSTRGKRFDILDIDPFGSPMPFLASSLRTVRRGGLISLTATDTAILCGVYPRVAFRRYGGFSIRCEYGNEAGARLLLAAAAREAMSINSGITPIFAHSSRHYIRVYFKLVVGASKADENIEQIGYISHCEYCGHREYRYRLERCPRCGNKMITAGPLWIGEIYSKSILEEAAKSRAEQPNAADRIISSALRECTLPPTYYRVDKAADRLNIRTPPMEEVMAQLEASGFRSSRTIFNPKGIRTEASAEEFDEALLRCVERGA